MARQVHSGTGGVLGEQHLERTHLIAAPAEQGGGVDLHVVRPKAAPVGTDALPLRDQHPRRRIICCTSHAAGQKARAGGERAQRGLGLRQEVCGLLVRHVKAGDDDHTWQARAVTTPRRQLEVKLGPVIVLLARLPKIVPFLVVLGLLLGGLLLQGIAGAALLLVLAALLGVLLYLAWPVLPRQSRVVRIGVVAVFVIRAVGFL